MPDFIVNRRPHTECAAASRFADVVGSIHYGINVDIIDFVAVVIKQSEAIKAVRVGFDILYAYVVNIAVFTVYHVMFLAIAPKGSKSDNVITRSARYILYFEVVTTYSQINTVKVVYVGYGVKMDIFQRNVSGENVVYRPITLMFNIDIFNMESVYIKPKHHIVKPNRRQTELPCGFLT